MKINITKDNRNIKYLYHYTLKENVDAILSSKQIKSTDDYMFFTDSYENAIELFEDEMMSDHLYYDLEGKLKRREPANKEDYRLIKIPYQNDGKFVIFNFDKEYPNSIYSRSRIHRGTLYFDKAEVLELGEYTKNNIFRVFDKLKLSLSLATFTLGLLPCLVKADSWLDDGNYNTSWYNEQPIYSVGLEDEKDLAGLNYLFTNDIAQIQQQYPYAQNPIYITKNDLDLTTHDWSTFPNVRTCICGVHRILLRGGQQLGLNACHPNSSLTINYQYKYSVEQSEHGTVTLDDEYLLSNEETVVRFTADEGYSLKGFYINDNYSSYDASIASQNINVSVKAPKNGNGPYEHVIKPEFKELELGVNEHYSDGVKYSVVNASYGSSYRVIYDSDYTFKVEIVDGFTLKSVTVNGEPVTLNSDGTYTIKNIKEDIDIEIETNNNFFKPSDQEDYIMKLWDKDQMLYGNYTVNRFLLNFAVDYNVFEKNSNDIGFKVFNNSGYLYQYSFEPDFIVNPNADITYNTYFDIDDKFRNEFADYFHEEFPSNYKRTITLAKDDSEINNIVKIKSFKKKELAKEAILIAPPTYNILRAFSNVEFTTVGDYITYEMVVENNTDETYTFEKIPNSKDYILYDIQINNEEGKILPNADTTAYITIKYDKQPDDNMYEKNIYLEERIIPLYILDKDGNRVALSASKDEDPVNPNTTAKNIIIFVSIVVVSGVVSIILLKTKKQQWVAPFVIVALMTIPVLINAEYNNNIELHSKVTIKKDISDIIIGGRKMNIARTRAQLCGEATIFVKSKKIQETTRHYAYEYGPDVIFPFLRGLDENMIEIGYEGKDGKKSFTANVTSSHDDVTDETTYECTGVSIPDSLTVEVDGKTNDEEAICNLIVSVSNQPCSNHEENDY